MNGKMYGRNGASWFEETFITAFVWRISSTPEELSSGQTGAGPVLVQVHNRPKQRIISNWHVWVAESAFVQKSSNKISKNWRFPS